MSSPVGSMVEDVTKGFNTAEELEELREFYQENFDIVSRANGQGWQNGKGNELKCQAIGRTYSSSIFQQVRYRMVSNQVH